MRPRKTTEARLPFENSTLRTHRPPAGEENGVTSGRGFCGPEAAGRRGSG